MTAHIARRRMEKDTMHLRCYHWQMSRASVVRRKRFYGLSPCKVRCAARERELRVSSPSSCPPPVADGSVLRPPRLPLSAFIAEDMNEFVHAHATYRFVIFDEEEERPRILVGHQTRFYRCPGRLTSFAIPQVWLFKPMMRLSYIVPTQYVIPKSASVRAAKVLFKILDAASAYADLEG